MRNLQMIMLVVLSHVLGSIPSHAQPVALENSKLTASDASLGDWFGSAVDGFESTLAVGKYFDDTACGGAVNCNSGAVYVFERTPAGAWSAGQKLIASNLSPTSYFGYAIDLQGNTLAVGSYAHPNGELIGAAYIFGRVSEGTPWSETKALTAPDSVPYLNFGNSVALSGDTLIVGAPGDSYPCPADPGICLAGSAYVFSRNAGGMNNWGFVKKLISPDGLAQQMFGTSVALENDLAVISAPGANPNSAAFVFERNLGGLDNWGFRKKIQPSAAGGNKGLLGRYPKALGLHGDFLIGGAPLDSRACVPPIYFCGIVHVFSRNAGGTNNWGEIAVVPPPLPTHASYYGETVSVVDSTYFLVGEGGQNTLSYPGRVHAFQASDSVNWVRTAQLVPSDFPGDASWAFGISVTHTPQFVAVGASLADLGCNGCDEGSVYIFDPRAGYLLFQDSFESSDTSRWSATEPPLL